jgi:hypothetical protein
MYCHGPYGAIPGCRLLPRFRGRDLRSDILPELGVKGGFAVRYIGYRGVSRGISRNFVGVDTWKYRRCSRVI